LEIGYAIDQSYYLRKTIISKRKTGVAITSLFLLVHPEFQTKQAVRGLSL